MATLGLPKGGRNTKLHAVCDGKGRPLGVVVDFLEYGRAPLLQVDAGGREVLVPLARSICHEIDVTGKIIRANLPEGLTEL